MPTDEPDAFSYEPLFRQLEAEGHAGWVQSLRTACEEAVQSDRHGLLPTWMELLKQIPVPEQPSWDIRDGHVVVPGRGSGVFFGQTPTANSKEPGPKKTPDPFDSMAALGQLLDFGQ